MLQIDLHDSLLITIGYIRLNKRTEKFVRKLKKIFMEPLDGVPMDR